MALGQGALSHERVRQIATLPWVPKALAGKTPPMAMWLLAIRRQQGTRADFLNLAVGTQALFTNPDGHSNTAIGFQALI